MSIVFQTYSTIGKNFVAVSKKIVKNVSIPVGHHCGSPSQDVFLSIHSKQGISNSYNNFYLSVVIQSIIGTELCKFFQSELEAPANIIRALLRCRNMLCCGESRRVVNLKNNFMTIWREVVHGILNDKCSTMLWSFTKIFLAIFLANAWQ